MRLPFGLHFVQRRVDLLAAVADPLYHFPYRIRAYAIFPRNIINFCPLAPRYAGPIRLAALPLAVGHLIAP